MFLAFNQVSGQAFRTETPLPGPHVDRLGLACSLERPPGEIAPCRSPCLDSGRAGLSIIQLAGFLAESISLAAATGNDNVGVDISLIAMCIRRMDGPRTSDPMTFVELAAPISDQHG